MVSSKLNTCVAALALALLAGGCGLTRGIAVGTFVPVLEKSVEASFRDPDVSTVKAGIPANLILLRGLCESEPGNAELRRLAAQTYFSYGMGFIEDEDPARAGLIYEEGRRLGLEGLRRKSWFQQAEKAIPLPDPKALKKMKREDVPLAFWTIANWSGWISQNLDQPEAVAQLPRVQAYLDRILELDAGYFYGMPEVLLGSLQTFRPRMLGGDPESGKRHFDEAIRISGGRMLIFKVMYAKYYCRQTLDEACFDQNLKDVLDAPEDLFPEFRLWNEIARDKARFLMDRRDELF
jgi:hypothetical protein